MSLIHPRNLDSANPFIVPAQPSPNPLSEEPAADITPMKREADGRSPLVRFLDAFLQEQNIKWVLGVGTAIVLGSSLMLVASHWQQYAPMWKHLIMIGYTSLIAVAGWWSYHKIHLRKTGTTLMALTVLLLPVMFLALHWVRGDMPLDPATITQGLTRDGPQQPILHLALLIATMLMAYLAASRIFRHFLRDSHPTFLVSYLTLCVAGVALPLIPDSLAPISALLLWVTASIGAIKVNRHVFWLVEEHRAPRIMGFFPIALLSGQFLLLFALHLAPLVPMQWLGLGCVLVAATVLITADTIARVFEQRTANLIRPLPVAIIAPIVVGLIFCATGLFFAAMAIGTTSPPLAMSPTAAIAAALLFLIARRTNHKAFVWAGLLAATIAYQFTPVFFRELAVQLMQSSATLIGEKKLPVAFYGLTYLPLIGVLMFLATLAKRRGHQLFSSPMFAFSTTLATMLLALSVTHAKAMMPVTFVMVAIFALQTILTRQPRIAILAVIALLLGAFGIVDFVHEISGNSLPLAARMICMIGAATVLLIPGIRIDHRLNAMLTGDATSNTDHEISSAATTRFNPCEAASLIVTLLLSACWAFTFGAHLAAPMQLLTPLPLLAAIGTLALLAAHSLHCKNAIIGLITLLFSYLFALTLAITLHIPSNTILSLAVIAMIAQWFLGKTLSRLPEHRLSLTFAAPIDVTSTLALTLSLALFGIAHGVCEITGQSLGSFSPAMICRVLLIAWGFIAAVRSSAPMLTTLSAIALFATSGGALIKHTGADLQWLPVLWSTIAGTLLVVVEVIRFRGSSELHRAIARPLDRIVLAVLAVTAIASLGVFTVPLRIAALIALAGMLVVGIIRRSILTRTICFALVNCQVLVLAAYLISPAELAKIFDLSSNTFRPIALPLGLLAAISVLIWQSVRNPVQHFTQSLMTAQRIALGFAAGLCLASSVYFASLTAIELALAGATFVLLIIAQLRSACRDKAEGDVWFALATAGMAVIYFVWHGAIQFGSGVSLFIPLLVASLLAITAKVAAQHDSIRIIARPFRRTALALPMLTVLLAVGRHLYSPNLMWLGGRSLALLLAGGFYFWHGSETKQRRFIVLAAAILNIALALLWNELALTDPQCFMIPIGITILGLVRLMRSEIPGELREPLNYLGALVILVSPTFHILSDGSWLHLFSLMLLSVLVILAAIGFRVRPLVYTGTAFLLADIVAMIVVGSINQPSLLWIAGIGLGGAVVTLGAIAERNREELLARLRVVSAAIAAWD